MTGYLEELSRLAIGDEVGSGGQASVHRVLSPQWPNTLLKKYRDVAPVAETLDALVSWRANLSDTDMEVLDTSTSWPLARVVDQGKTVGVLIPEAPDHFAVDVRGSRRLNELSYLVFGDRSKRLGLPVPEPYVRAAIATNLAAVMELFERHDIVHGDLSFKNLLWTSTPSPSCYLLDCDGVQMRDLPPALPHVTTQHWTDPRIQTGTIRHPDVDSDRLAMALVFYRSYFQARGDFTGAKIALPVPDVPAVDPGVRELLERALVDHAPRPAAKEWRVLERVVAARAQDIDLGSNTVSNLSAAPRTGENPRDETIARSSFSTTVDLVPDGPSVYAPTNSPSISAPVAAAPVATAATQTNPAATTTSEPAFTGTWILVLVLLFVISLAGGFFVVTSLV